jgi:hypothetical protein
MSAPLSPEQFAAAQDKNYSQYVAVLPIHIGGALAYLPGHAVSAVSVEDGTVDKSLVAKVGTKAAEAVGNAPTPAPTA